MAQKQNNYEDIIHLPHHVSTTHPQMDAMNRAAQFSPFAALTGYEDAISETGRITDSMMELTEDALRSLDERLAFMRDDHGQKEEYCFTVFVPDLKKEGGAYKQKTGIVKRIDEINRVVILEDGTQLSIDAIIGISQMES